MSWSVTAIIKTLVAATATSAQGAHHGHDKRRVRSVFAMASETARSRVSGRVNFPFRNRSKVAEI